ncbi:hypothetical protein DB44_CR00180 [Candidatus Protochlamydia amoebophila]|uniref:Uncharacterized protein n=1 Tax=Candidatus Protochlamydia amoebophila TaxID=362787 RepID=A0A0C1JNF4_9BACT|nr:hypothetical protein DB44_CR00180 [Candidatus Protochlamydia amoebophila]
MISFLKTFQTVPLNTLRIKEKGLDPITILLLIEYIWLKRRFGINNICLETRLKLEIQKLE